MGRAEVEVRVEKLTNDNAEGNDEMTREMIKSRGDRVVDWIWSLCDIAFESDVGFED